jgi:hypothetical protein
VSSVLSGFADKGAYKGVARILEREEHNLRARAINTSTTSKHHVLN